MTMAIDLVCGMIVDDKSAVTTASNLTIRR